MIPQANTAGFPPFFSDSGPEAGSFNGQHPKINFLATIIIIDMDPIHGRVIIQ
jgi:hypothetical protein